MIFENIAKNIMPFNLKIGDRVELNGKQGSIIKVGRIGIPYALTIQWDENSKVEVIFDERRCLSVVKVDTE